MGLLQWAIVFLLISVVVGSGGFAGIASGKSNSVATPAKVVSGTFLAIAVTLLILVVFGIRPMA